MATWKNFEELKVWQKARVLCQKIYAVTNRPPFSTDYRFKDQYRAAGGSIMDNIAEGFERGGTKEFIQFVGHSKGSAGEVRSQTYRALDVHHISKEEFDDIFNDAVEISKMLNGLTTYLKECEIKGNKFK
jgi:four helix bundle protein